MCSAIGHFRVCALHTGKTLKFAKKTSNAQFTTSAGLRMQQMSASLKVANAVWRFIKPSMAANLDGKWQKKQERQVLNLKIIDVTA